MKKGRISGQTYMQLIHANRYTPYTEREMAYDIYIKGKNKWERRIIVAQSKVRSQLKNSAQ